MIRVILGCLLLGLAAAGVGQAQTMPAGDDKVRLEKPAAAGDRTATAEKPAASQPASFHQFTVKDIDGHEKSLGDYAGKVVLVVNVASKCGFTPQYEGLENLYKEYRDKGLVVLGAPSNDFGGQEPGTEAEIKAFCSTKYAVTFPMLAKMHVKNGPEQGDLYNYLTHKSRNGVLDAQIAWNFNKILVGKDGRLVRYFPSKVKPDDPKLAEAIEEALGQATAR